MRTKTFVWLALCFITALSVGLMILAIFYYDYEQFDKSNDFEDDSVKMIKKSENSFILFYSLEDPNFGFQNSWQSFRMKIQDWNKTNIVYVGKIECSVFRTTCLSFKVDRYPTIAWIKNGKVVEEYVGDDISESIKKFFDKLVTIVTEQKSTTVKGDVSSVKIVPPSDILQGGSFDIIRRFIEGEKVQNVVSTVAPKTTEATTVSMTEIITQTSSNSYTTQAVEVKNTTTFSNITNEEQIVERINITEPVETATSENPKVTDETFTSSLLIPDSTLIEYETSTPEIHDHSSTEVETTTVDDSSSESIIMTRPTKTQSSEQETSKESVESTKNESDEDETPDDDDEDPFGLGGLFGNTDGNNAEDEEENEDDENNDTENEDNDDVKESEETSVPKYSVETEEKLSTRSIQKKEESAEKKKQSKATKHKSESEESKKTSAKESKSQKEIKTKMESTTKKYKYSKKKSVSYKKSKSRKDKSEIKEYKTKSGKDSRSRRSRKAESTTKKYKYSEDKKKYTKESKTKKSKSESKEHKKHRESSKHK